MRPSFRFATYWHPAEQKPLTHTWDLARASGQDVSLEPDFCIGLLAGMEPIEHAMRSSGQYGPKVQVPADADPPTRLIGFIGRDPSWRGDTPAS